LFNFYLTILNQNFNKYFFFFKKKEIFIKVLI